MSPPPLPEALSARLQSSIDPATGTCKHHPSVQLCELVQNNTRWVVRRKICYKCGSRPGSNGARHKPGVAVSNPSNSNSGGGGGGREGRVQSRSASRERRRSTSTSKSNRGGDASAPRRRDRLRSQSQSAIGTRHDLHVSGFLAASSHRIEASGRGRRRDDGGRRGRSSSRGVVAEGGGGRRPSGGRGSEKVDVEPAAAAPGDAAAAPPAAEGRRAAKSYHGRALEFTQRVMEDSKPPISTAIVPAAPPPPNPPSPIEDSPDYDQSDPIIVIPAINVGGGGAAAETDLPPPPPRTPEEMERHQERLEMRRASIRREREVRRRRRGSGAVKGGATPPQARERRAAGEEERRRDRRRRADEDPPQEREREKSAQGEGTKATAEDPPKETRRERRRHDKSHDDIRPSPAVMALLEGNTPPAAAKTTERPNRRHSSDPRRGSKKDPLEKQSRPHRQEKEKASAARDDDYKSETSSISSASAKQVKGHERTRRRPELEGVRLPTQLVGAVPADVTIRSRSQSRSRRSRRGGAGDPPATTPGDRSRGRGASRGAVSRALCAAAERRPRRGRDSSREKGVSVREDATREDGRSLSRQASRQLPRRDRSRSQRREGHGRSDESAPALAASSARSARRGRVASGQRSVTTARNRRWDHDGNPISNAREGDDAMAKGGNHERRGSRSRSVRAGAQSSSPGKSRARSEGGGDLMGPRSKSVSTRRAVASGNDLRKSHGANRGHISTVSGYSKGGRSRVTNSTHPESLSSEEVARLNSSDEKEAAATTLDMDLEEEQEEQVEEEEEEKHSVALYKKRVRRAAQKEDAHDDGTAADHAKPMNLIACSSDEKSHASSISSSSTMIEEYGDWDEEGGGDADDGKQNVRAKALSALQGARGGAMNIATKGKSALKLGGLKGTSRKLQSALFI